MLPLSSLLFQAQLLASLEREMLIACNSSGVHLNAAALLAHRAPQLAFVSGLGPVKAHDLVAKVKKLRNGQCTSRIELRDRGLLGHKVFANAAGFLRVRDYPSVYLNPIDDTRIHPETYLSNDRDGMGEFAQTMVSVG